MRGSWLSEQGCLWVTCKMLGQYSYHTGTQKGVLAQGSPNSLSPMQQFSGKAQGFSVQVKGRRTVYPRLSVNAPVVSRQPGDLIMA